MTRIRSSRPWSFAAGLIAAVALLSSTGCGFCVTDFTCGAGCCVGFQCREPKDCPLMLAPAKPKNIAPAQPEQIQPEPARP